MYLNVIYESGKKRFIPLSESMLVLDVNMLVQVYRSIPQVKEVYVNVKDPNYEKESNNN